MGSILTNQGKFIKATGKIMKNYLDKNEFHQTLVAKPNKDNYFTFTL